LSHSIKALETEVGCRLFERTGGKLILNHAGEQLLAAVMEEAITSQTAGVSATTQSRF
jgi:DNA-binding transcriptional LysR family regulator